ncbi:hypothetical protein L1987_62228 [Smallanthus sonchifolius]|uniref:Uncharacterized protein n=1 Tax=Smallanthus sonchifolius TaxID=185202 RepID=A0ACB9CA07_9ASTR|nr:hypothetical protein L1987_62228 [Smallanthus sonchifolius]
MLLRYINIFFLVLRTARSIDTISVHQNISDGETIVSENAEFELGFFSPGSSKSRYLGIWFKKTSPQTVVWVANQVTPLKGTLGAVKLDNQGNLTLVGGSSKVIWSSNTLASPTNINLVAQLLDTGNLVIKNENTTNIEDFIWQSFDYPGDTYIPGMKLGKNIITGRDSYLTSWRSADDPSPGKYSYRFLMVKGKYPQVCITRSSAIVTRIGPNNGISFSGLANCAPDTNSSYIHCMIRTRYTPVDLKEKNSEDKDISFCQRRIALDCGPGEGFLKFSSMKLPDTENVVFSSNMSLLDCEVACKNNCSCTAYANPNITSGGVGCLLWYGGLIDVRVYPQNGQDLYVRLATSELSGLQSSFHTKKRLVMVVTLSISAVLTFLGLILAFYIRRKWKKTSNAENIRQMGSAEGYISPEYAMNGLYSVKSDIFNFGVLVLEIVSGKKNRGFVHKDHDDNLLGHGYISPEYAMNGLYSVKSDIFNFGVLVLEIVSGKKNRGFVHKDHDDNLLGHVSA